MTTNKKSEQDVYGWYVKAKSIVGHSSYVGPFHSVVAAAKWVEDYRPNGEWQKISIVRKTKQICERGEK